METYLFKFSACLAIFWLVYLLFLERQTMHRFKRFYLLGAVFAALIIPALTITHYIEPIVRNFEISPEFIPYETSLNVIPVQAVFWDLETVLWMIYGLGVILFSLRFVINLFKMYKRISDHETITKRTFIYVLLEECRIPHSFFKYLFFDKSKYESNSIPEEVKLHEETHAKQLHSLDIIVIELLQIVFWFHPLIYMLKHHIKLNHEFLADQAVIEQGADTKTYQNLLLQFSSNAQDYQLSSAINYSSIKKRFTVMKTQTSKTRIWLSSLLLLPVIAILFYSFAEKEYVEKLTTEKSPFLITLEKKANSIELRCKNGCKWSHLTLDPSSEPYIINDYGFSEGKTIETDNFTFTIQPRENGVNLNGLRGTAWKDLSFSLNENNEQAIDKFGMTTIKPENLEDNYIGKHVEIKAINNKLTIDGISISLYNYSNEFNKITQNWSEADFKSTIPELEIKNCSQEFLDQLDAEFRKSNYFLISIQGSKSYAEKNDWQKIEDSKDQENATPKQVAEYNALAKKYNKQPQDKRVVKLTDLKRLEYIYGLMSKQQKVNAEPFPDCPPPPPPTTKNPSFVDYIIEMEQKGATFYMNGKKISANEAKVIAKSNKGKKTDMITHLDDNGYYIVKLSENMDHLPPPPPAIKSGKINDSQIENYNNWVKSLKDPNSNYQMVKKKDYEYFMSIYNLMTDEQKKKTIGLPPPPPPPAPETTLDFVIRMAKANAKFYNEGKAISSDKAIALIKGNDKLNINAKEKGDNGESIVFITKKPIIIGNNKKSKN